MDKFISLEEQQQNLREQAIKEIEKIVSSSPESEVKFPEPIHWGGFESDPLTAEVITSSQIIIFHKEKEVVRVQWRLLTLDKLIEIGMVLG